MGEVPKSYSKFNLNCVCVFLVKAMYLFVCVCWNDYPEARYKYPFSEISQHIQQSIPYGLSFRDLPHGRAEKEMKISIKKE